MANEAAVTLVMRMRDEASPQMQQFGQATQQAQMEALQFNVALSSMGSALTAVGGLLGRLDDPMAKMAANFMQTAGAMFATVSAIMVMLPQIRQLITWLRQLAIVQSIVQALAGPKGWITLGVGMALAGAATAGIVAMTGGFGGGGGGTNVNINTTAFMGNEADARKFAQKTTRFARENERIGR